MVAAATARHKGAPTEDFANGGRDSKLPPRESVEASSTARKAAGALFEREAELAATEAATSRARGGSGGLLLIEGPAGIGKSRLLEAACENAAEAGMTVLDAHGSELERGFSFGVVLQLLGGRVGDAADDEDLFEGPARFARRVFEDARPNGRGGADTTFPIYHGLHWLVAHLAERAPLALAVDDVHWADDESLAFLAYVAARCRELPLLLVLTSRLGEPVSPHAASVLDELRIGPAATVLHPAPLSPAASARRVRQALPDASDQFCSACGDAAGGNPLYLRELITAAVERGLDPRAETAGEISTLSPDSVSRQVVSRMRRLPAPAPELAGALSVLGPGAALRHAAAMCEIDLDAAGRAADDLAQADILTPGIAPRFAHPVVAAAVYGDMPASQRGRLHLRAARLLHEEARAPEAVSAQLLRAAPCGEQWVPEVLIDAADRARSRGTPRTAVRYLRRALDDGTDAAARGEILARLGLAEAEAGEGTGAETLLSGVELISEPRQRAEAMLDLTMVLLHGGQYPRAGRVAERGLSEIGDGEADELRDRLAVVRTLSELWTNIGDPAGTPARVDAARDLAREVRGRAANALLANCAATLAFCGADAATIAAAAREALPGTEPSEDPYDSYTFPLAAFLLAIAGSPEDGEAVMSATVDWAMRRGSILELGAAMHVRSIARYRRGRIVESVADAERAADAGGSGWGATLPLAHAQLALGRLELGDVEGASGALELPGGEQRWAGHVAYGAYLVARAEVLRARGEPEAALEQFELAGRLGEMVGVSMPALLPWRLGASAILVDRGEREHAAELAERQLEDARAYGAAGPIGAALRGLARTRGGADAVELLRESADLLDDAPDRLERARSLVELGAAMRRSGSRRNARDVLRQGLDAAYGCGAVALAELARAELRAAGGRLRRDALSGPEALTPSERRVAELALDGMTNREIAQHLFVTKRTVEMHLSGAYGKLRIGSREELGPALDSRSPALAE